MFLARNLSKLLFGDSSKESIVEVPQGQLYLVRPLSVKGYSELIFRDSAASIRRTGQDFQYQLVIQRAYEEGEDELLEDEEGEDAGLEALGGEKDEKTFLLDESLEFRTDIRQTGEKVFAWRDLSGDTRDLWEFVCDHLTPEATVETFERVAQQAQFERKYRKPGAQASEKDLQEFSFSEEPIPAASPISSPITRSPVLSPSHKAQPPPAAPSGPTAVEELMATKTTLKGKAVKKDPDTSSKPKPPPKSAAQPQSLETLADEDAELHFFDAESGTFIIQDSQVRAAVSEVGNWNYWMHIAGKDKDWLGQPVQPDINPVFNFQYLSFIFNHYPEEGSAYSWLLRFKDDKAVERFQQALMTALWEHLNQVKWAKAKEVDREYVLDAFQDLTMEDANAQAEEEEEEEEEGEGEDEDDDGQRSEHYDSDESEDDVVTRDEDGNVNSQLAVGYKHDRSFVVRGSKIGVFKHTPDNRLEFATNISKVATPKGKLFSPTKVMLHTEDRDMILQNADNPNALYRMDLETGKVVDEWKVHDHVPVTNFAPGSKFAQMSGEQTFLGTSRNALFKVDPRLAGNKMVDAQYKQYATKMDFSAAATTEQGYIAIANTKGEIRMFDRLGINAKTQLPGLGDSIIGLDVSADGRWTLATTKNYLLLVDNLQKEGKNEGKLGFQKAFGKDSKPQPRRLVLAPNHVAQFVHETKVPISFTPAKFNTGLDSTETTIVTGTGPFVVIWNLKHVLQNRKDPYKIKRYAEDIKADNFKFGSDKNLVVALPNEVGMVAKRALQRPTRESIAAPSLVGGGRRSTPRKGYISRNDIVNSPY